MRTEIYSEYAGFLNLIEKQIPAKFKQRYLYIALQDNEEVKTDTEQIIDKITSGQEEIRKDLREQKEDISKIDAEIKKQLKDQDTKIDKLDEKMNEILKLLQVQK